MPNRPELVLRGNPSVSRSCPNFSDLSRVPDPAHFRLSFASSSSISFPNVFYLTYLRFIISYLYRSSSFNDRSDEYSRFIYEVAIRRCFITHVFWPMRIRWPADEYLTIGLFTVLIDDAQSTLLLRLMARFGWLRVTELPVGRSEIVTQGMLFRSSIGGVRLICLEICDFGRLFKGWITLRWLLDYEQF